VVTRRRGLYLHRTTQHIKTQETNIHAPSGIRTRDPSNLAAADLRLRPRRHWNRHFELNAEINYSMNTQLNCVLYFVLVSFFSQILHHLIFTGEFEGCIHLPCHLNTPFIPEGGVGQTQAWMPTYVSILRIPQMI
jgi:hypothetical protein